MKSRSDDTLEGESHFQVAFEQASVGMTIVSPEGRWLHVNRKLCAMLGYTQDELMALTFQDVTYPDDLEADLDNTRLILSGEVSAFSMEKRYIRKNSSVFWANLQVSLVRKPDNTPDYFISVVEDIQNRKEIEADFREAKRIARLGHWTWDGVDKLAWSEELYAIYGRDLALPPPDWQEAERYYTAESWNKLSAVRQKCWLDGVAFSCDAEVKRQDGVSRWVTIRGEVIHDAAEHVVAMHGTVQDITERKSAEMALQQLNADLENRVADRTAKLNTLNQSLESFVYSVSHDLKAPLRGIEGYSQLLEEDYTDRLNDEGRLFIHNIRAGVQRMNELIDGLLTYSRMERRHLEAGVLNLSVLVHQVLEEFREDIMVNDVEVSADLPSLMVHGDRDGLAMALRNLLGNAIKFSQRMAHPRIEFGCRQEGELITLWIRDNGIGFDMKYSQRIFEIFERLHRQEDYPGTGVGLALVRKAMHRMGGEVRVESAPGEGATFYLQLPGERRNPDQQCHPLQ